MQFFDQEEFLIDETQMLEEEYDISNAIILKDPWIMQMNEYLFKKLVSRIQVYSTKKIKSYYNMLEKRLLRSTGQTT